MATLKPLPVLGPRSTLRRAAIVGPQICPAVSRKQLLRFEFYLIHNICELRNSSVRDRRVTQGSSITVCGTWMKRLITTGVAVAISVGMTRGFFAAGPDAQLSTPTAQSHNVASESARAGGVRWNDDGCAEGLTATLGYPSPELMVTGSIRLGHNVAQR